MPPFTAGWSYSRNFTEFQGRVYFWARIDSEDSSLWSTDGSTAGTVQYQAENPLSAFLEDPYMTVASGRLWFRATNGVTGLELWSTSGTPADLRPFADLVRNNVTRSSGPAGLVRLGDNVIFAATASGLFERGTLQSTNGVPGQVEELADVNSFQPAEVWGETNVGVIFSNRNSFTGLVHELWRTDGTADGTSEFLDVDPYGIDGQSAGFARLQGDFLFTCASASQLQAQLMRTDGTAKGSYAIGSFSKGWYEGALTDSATLDGHLYFCKLDGNDFKYELWRSDGTEIGSRVVATFKAGPDSSRPSDFTAINGDIYFVAYAEETGRELVRWNTSTESLELVVDIEPGPVGSSPSSLTVFGDELFFSAETTQLGREPWKSDGTVEGTQLLLDLEPGSSGSLPTAFVPIHDILLIFTGNTSVPAARGFWFSDGTSAGTEQVTLPTDATFKGAPEGIAIALGGTEEVVLAAEVATNGGELWRWLGPGSLPEMLPEVNVSYEASLPDELVELNGNLIFVATSFARGREIYVYELARLGAFGGESFGHGCSNADAPTAGLSGSATPGETLNIEVASAQPFAMGSLFLGVNVALDLIEPGCTIYIDSPALLASLVADSDGAGSVAVPVPNDSALVGLRVLTQWLTSEAGGPVGESFALSDALEIVIGA